MTQVGDFVNECIAYFMTPHRYHQQNNEHYEIVFSESWKIKFPADKKSIILIPDTKVRDRYYIYITLFFDLPIRDYDTYLSSFLDYDYVFKDINEIDGKSIISRTGSLTKGAKN